MALIHEHVVNLTEHIVRNQAGFFWSEVHRYSEESSLRRFHLTD